GRDRLLVDGADGPDGHAHLVQVAAAPEAVLDVLVEPADVGVREGALQVVRNQFDELLAAHRGDGAHLAFIASVLNSIAPRCFSIAPRTFERARCRSTRWLPSLMPSASATSSGG